MLVSELQSFQAPSPWLKILSWAALELTFCSWSDGFAASHLHTNLFEHRELGILSLFNLKIMFFLSWFSFFFFFKDVLSLLCVITVIDWLIDWFLYRHLLPTVSSWPHSCLFPYLVCITLWSYVQVPKDILFYHPGFRRIQHLWRLGCTQANISLPRCLYESFGGFSGFIRTVSTSPDNFAKKCACIL